MNIHGGLPTIVGLWDIMGYTMIYSRFSLSDITVGLKVL